MLFTVIPLCAILMFEFGLQYSVKEILLQLLSRQGEKLHKKLLGRRYLIVLDDVWSVEAWDRIRLFLPDDGISGSRVAVTTRLQSVADCFALQ